MSQIINIDPPKRDSALGVHRLYGTTRLLFEIDQEQNNIYDFNGDVNLSYLMGKDALTFASHEEFTTSGNQELLNAGFFHLRYNEHMASSIHLEYFTQYQWNDVRGMLGRVLLGSNIRFTLLKNSKWMAFLGTGMMYEHERWAYTAVPVEKTPLNDSPVESNYLKANLYIKLHKTISNSAEFVFINYLQARPDKNIVYPRISTSVQLNFTISKHFNFTMAYDNSYDSKPIVPIKHFYFSVTNGITLVF